MVESVVELSPLKGGDWMLKWWWKLGDIGMSERFTGLRGLD